MAKKQILNAVWGEDGVFRVPEIEPNVDHWSMIRDDLERVYGPDLDDQAPEGFQGGYCEPGAFQFNHRDRGWKTIDDVMREMGKKIQEDIEEQIRRMFRP